MSVQSRTAYPILKTVVIGLGKIILIVFAWICKVLGWILTKISDLIFSSLKL